LDEYKKKASSGDAAAARVVGVMSNPALVAWTENLIRFEATVKKRWFEKRSIPTNLFQLIKYQESLKSEGRDFLREIWTDTTKDIFQALEGQTMRLTDDDSVLSALKKVHFRVTPKGNISYAKADKLFLFYNGIRDYGYDGLQLRLPRNTFWRHVKDLQLCGFSKAFLQNLSADMKQNNVVPILRFVSVDFSAQRPDWYAEPSFKLKLVA